MSQKKLDHFLLLPSFNQLHIVALFSSVLLRGVMSKLVAQMKLNVTVMINIQNIMYDCLTSNHVINAVSTTSVVCLTIKYHLYFTAHFPPTPSPVS